jgi:thiamine transport system ATP-binding protein
VSVYLNNVSVQYGETLAVDSLQLEINNGERFALMGPSGSGKSTLLRAVAGLEPLASGTVTIDGSNVTTLPAHLRPVGLMFQEYALFPHMNVRDNIAYGLRMNGTPKRRASRIASELLALAELAGFEERSPASLSGGERQRVALLRTLAPEPSLVMLDEPLGSLDLALRESLLAQMRTIVTKLGATTLYVTHDRTEAFAFAERLAILRRGRIVRTGTPQEIWDDPRTTFVARFIGHANVLAGSALGVKEASILVPPGAIAIDDSGNLTVRVLGSIFTDGHHEVTAVLPDGENLTFNSAKPLTVDRSVRLAVELSGIKELTIDEV